MANSFYDKHLPDYGDLDNGTGTCPGYRFGVRENDGGIGIDMGPIQNDVDDDSYYRAFMNIEEALDLVQALQAAIARAQSKSGRGLPHPNRVRKT